MRRSSCRVYRQGRWRKVGAPALTLYSALKRERTRHRWLGGRLLGAQKANGTTSSELEKEGAS